MPVTTPKFPPPPRSPQNRSAFSSPLARTSRPVGGHDVHPDDVVRRPAPTPRQVAEPTAQGESGDAGERDEAEDGGEPVHLRLAVHVAEQATGLRVGDLVLRVDPHAAHERHVEHQRAVGRGQARDVVSAALDAEQELVLARELHAGDHVGDAEAARDDRGTSVDHGVPDGPGLLVAGVARHEHRSAQARLQAVERVLLQLDLATFHRLRSHAPAPFCIACRVMIAPSVSTATDALTASAAPGADTPDTPHRTSH